MLHVEPARTGVAGQKLEMRVIDAPVDRGEHGADHRVAITVILFDPADEVAGERFDGQVAPPVGGLHRRHLFLREALEDAGRKPVLRLARELGGAEDRRRLGHAGVLALIQARA
jgi:hypothetical protein